MFCNVTIGLKRKNVGLKQKVILRKIYLINILGIN